jgi:hydrogenase maturation protease
MTDSSRTRKVLVMGVGNTLLQDDGIGVHVTETLKASQDPQANYEIIDGGTIGLSLLPEIEDADAVIIVDASEIGEPPGSMRIFHNKEIDLQLSGNKKTVHEVALSDLFSAAAIRGRCPARRALIAIQPASTDLGLKPTPAVKAAIPGACAAITTITRRWTNET